MEILKIDTRSFAKKQKTVNYYQKTILTDYLFYQYIFKFKFLYSIL